MSSLVSIITPVYNSEAYLNDCINSVINQTYDNWELILVDDHSKDNSLNMLNDYAQLDSRIKVFQTVTNGGPVKARNLGIEKSTGTYIAFLDSDDLWYDNKLALQIRFMADKQYAISYSNYDVIDEKGTFLKTLSQPDSANYNKLIRSNYMGCLTVIYNADILGKRYFISSEQGAEDFILWLSILKEGYTAYNVGISLAKYRIVQSSRSRNKIYVAKGQWYVYRKIENINLFKSILYFIDYALKGFIKNN